MHRESRNLLRFSTDEERQPFSLEAPNDRWASYVASQPGWHVVRSFSDQMSGKTLDRPALQQALTDARNWVLLGSSMTSKPRAWCFAPRRSALRHRNRGRSNDGPRCSACSASSSER